MRPVILTGLWGRVNKLTYVNHLEYFLAKGRMPYVVATVTMILACTPFVVGVLFRYT